MSLAFTHGSGFNATVASADYPDLTADWHGAVSFYTAYPGTASLAVDMVRNGNHFVLTITPEQILALNLGVYSFVTVMTNAVLGLSFTTVEYVSVLDIAVGTMCKIFGIIRKPDGTAAGKLVQKMGSSMGESRVRPAVYYVWEGIALNMKLSQAVVEDGVVIDTETITVYPGGTGYFEVNILQGLHVVVTSPCLGKALTLDTTGLATIDLSDEF